MHDPTLISLDSIPTCDRWTDRQTDGHAARTEVTHMRTIVDARQKSFPQ